MNPKTKAAILNGVATAGLTYIGDAFQRAALGGPKVVLGAVVLGAVLTACARGIGLWVRSMTDTTGGTTT